MFLKKKKDNQSAAIKTYVWSKLPTNVTLDSVTFALARNIKH